MRFSGLAWTRDNRGFFYSRYPEPPPGKPTRRRSPDHALYYHRIGTPQSEDVLIFARPDLPTWFVHGTVSEDGQYLLIALFEGRRPTAIGLYFADLGEPASPDVRAPIRALVEADGAEYAPIGVERGRCSCARTRRRRTAACSRSISAPAQPGGGWSSPSAGIGSSAVALAGGRLVRRITGRRAEPLDVLDLWTGAPLGRLALPAPGVVTALDGRSADRRTPG